MRIHGYCTECHRFRLVYAKSADLVMAQARGGVVQGICDECTDKRKGAIR